MLAFQGMCAMGSLGLGTRKELWGCLLREHGAMEWASVRIFQGGVENERTALCAVFDEASQSVLSSLKACRS